MLGKWDEKKVYQIFCVVVSVLLLVILIHIMMEPKKEEKKIKKEVPEKEQVTEEQVIENPMVHVLIKTDGFKEEVHPVVELSAPSGLQIRSGEQAETIGGGETLALAPDDGRFQNGAVKVTPVNTGEKITVLSLQRGYGNPAYRGEMELHSTAEGVALVNILPMEEYLYGVVPSEMPASYEPEALKCQAVCARSYAYCQIMGMEYPQYGAQIDDSTSFQVYNNSKEQESTCKAVEETKGKKLMYGGNPVNAYYYSTSCGRTTDMDAWGGKNEGNAYLAGVNVCNEEGDFEKNLPWYRWSIVLSTETLSNLIGSNTRTDIGTLQSLEVTKRGAGDIALEIVASGDRGSVTVATENKIRRALGGDAYMIQRNDGSETPGRELLPSAFFTIEQNADTYTIRGGGFGHGIGMSQNGANEMAKQGMDYISILKTFYADISVE